MMGYLAREGRSDPASLMRAAAHGIAMASFTVGGFGPQHIADIPLERVEERVHQLRAICTF
jgi:hypothetical protein